MEESCPLEFLGGRAFRSDKKQQATRAGLSPTFGFCRGALRAPVRLSQIKNGGAEPSPANIKDGGPQGPCGLGPAESSFVAPPQKLPFPRPLGKGARGTTAGEGCSQLALKFLALTLPRWYITTGRRKTNKARPRFRSAGPRGPRLLPLLVKAPFRAARICFCRAALDGCTYLHL